MAAFERGGMMFESDSQQTVTDTVEAKPSIKTPYPDPILTMPATRMEAFKSWLQLWLNQLISAHNEKIEQWAEEETDYRALSDGPQKIPFDGACGDKVPAIAMAVDPIKARLSTGIFKTDQVFRLKALKKSYLDAVPALEEWVEYYQRHMLKLRQMMSPRLNEFAKHGTMVVKVIYDRDEYPIMTYDTNWKAVKKTVTRFSGPRWVGVPLNDFCFPAGYQDLKDCPIVAERIRLTASELRIAAKKGLLDKAAVEAVCGMETTYRTRLEQSQQDASQHHDSYPTGKYHELWEVWCEYDDSGDGLPERMVATVHLPSMTLLQLRYNWYFHQRKPYVVVPYAVAANSLYGIGIAEMVKPFQDMLTKWHRVAQDNAYLANIRMFVARKDAGIENRPQMYSGRVFRTDDPKSDIIPFGMADVYPSTLHQQQNLFGMAEKRTGVSDYLTGRESPIIGSRATATSTMALIQEGTRRVEDVMENVRWGMAELMEMTFAIWIQYGLDGLDEIVFKGEDTQKKLVEFFNDVNAVNVNGAVAIDLSVTDAGSNRIAQQQMQLAVIQVMMQYLEKLTQIGGMALQAKAQDPNAAQMYVEVMGAARSMFKDLLQKYDIRNPDDYLPDLEKFVNGTGEEGGVPSDDSGATGAGGIEGLIASVKAKAGMGVPAGPAGGLAPGGMPTVGTPGTPGMGAPVPAGPSGGI